MKRSLLLFGVIALLFCSALTAFAQIPNASFENWTAGSPDNWFVNNVSALGWTPVTRTSTAHSGTYALRGDVITMPTGGVLSPQIITGTSAAGFAVNQRYGAITGYYQFSPSSGDRFFVTAAMYKGGASGVGVAAAGGYLTTAASSYTQFSFMAVI